MRNILPKWKKWQKVWKNRITHYTPRVDPKHSDVEIDGVIENWNPKKAKGESQTTTVKISPLFGPDIVALYSSANSAYNPASPIKSAEDADVLRQLVAMDLRFMIGCDCEWNFPEDPEPAANPGALRPVLPPATASDDAAGANAAAAPAGDPHDITKWDVLNPASIPFARLQYDPANLASARSAHAALILFFLSEDLERAHVGAAQAINAGYQARFQRPVNYADLRNYPLIGPNAYTSEEIKWCEATIDYLAGQLSDEARLVRSMPAAKRTRGRAESRAAAAPSPVPPSKPPPQLRKTPPPQRRKTQPSKAADDDTEDDDAGSLVTPISRKRAPKARYMILSTKLSYYWHIMRI